MSKRETSYPIYAVDINISETHICTHPNMFDICRFRYKGCWWRRQAAERVPRDCSSLSSQEDKLSHFYSSQISLYGSLIVL